MNAVDLNGEAIHRNRPNVALTNDAAAPTGTSPAKSPLRLKTAAKREMLAEILVECEICYEPLNRKGLRLDHDHETGNTRGVLCNTCNIALGLMEDNEEILKNGISYLRKFRRKNNGPNQRPLRTRSTDPINEQRGRLLLLLCNKLSSNRERLLNVLLSGRMPKSVDPSSELGQWLKAFLEWWSNQLTGTQYKFRRLIKRQMDEPNWI